MYRKTLRAILFVDTPTNLSDTLPFRIPILSTNLSLSEVSSLIPLNTQLFVSMIWHSWLEEREESVIDWFDRYFFSRL